MSIPEGSKYNDKIREIGEIAEHLPDEYISSFVAEEVILFGSAVARGTEAEKTKTISSATNELLGVAAKSFEASNFDDAAYAANDPVGVVRTGIVVVWVEESVQPGDKVRVRHTSVSGKPAGVFCKTSEAGKTAVVEHAEWKSASEDGRAVLWVSGPLKMIAD